MPITAEMDATYVPQTVTMRPGESLFTAWMRGIEARPIGHSGPIVIR